MKLRPLIPLSFATAGLLVVAIFYAASGSAALSSITRVSVDSSEVEALGGGSDNPAITPDGRLVAFASGATNLVSGDNNGQSDIFVRDRQTGTTERISVDSAGSEADLASYNPDFSSAGRYVAFVSRATNLVSGDTKGKNDVFVHDRQTGVTERVSVDSAGNEADGDSSYPSISGDGRYVAFVSSATNLVAGDTNDINDVFVHDRQTDVTERVSVSNAGQQATTSNSESAEISQNGRFVAFDTGAPLVAGDTNGKYDVFVRDRQAHTTERVSVSTGSDEADDSSFYPGITPDGRFVVFQSRATNLVPGDGNGKQDILLRDRLAGTTERVSVGIGGSEINDSSYDQAISADGRFILFDTRGTNAVPADNNSKADVFVYDRQTGATELMSVNNSGQQGDNDSYGSDYPNTLSADGRYLAIMSDATNLVSGDGNNVRDIFVRDRGPAPTPSPTPTPTPSPSPSPTPTHSATPTPTHSPTPTATQSVTRVQGDINCDGVIDEIDFELLLEFVATLNDGTTLGPCPDIGLLETISSYKWGDVNCDGFVNALDVLYLLVFKVQLHTLASPPPGCFPVGSVMT